MLFVVIALAKYIFNRFILKINLVIVVLTYVNKRVTKEIPHHKAGHLLSPAASSI